MPQLTLEARSDARVALESARDHLLSLQDDAGWWRGELQTNVTMDAEDMLLREFLGVRDRGASERSAAWIRSQQRDDGTWANFHGGPGELSTTIEAYWALRLAGDPAEAGHMRAAAEFIRAEGGIERARVFTHLWLALFGLWSWDRVPALPPEIILLPVAGAPERLRLRLLGPPDDRRPLHRQSPPPGAAIGLRPAGAGGPCRQAGAPGREPSGRGAWLKRLDRILRLYERRPLAPLRRLALARAEQWIVRRQEGDGSWGGIQPPWVYSLIALNVAGYPLDHPVMRRGLEGLDGFMVEDEGDSRGVGAPQGPSRRLEACQSPVWDTALAMVALADAGLGEEHPAMVLAAEWLLGEEVTQLGDWAVVRPGVQPGGWAFEFANVNYPDIDDTAEVVIALERVLGPAAQNGSRGDLARRIAGARERAVRWIEGMQSSDGGWGAFDADNTRSLVRELPFLDFGEVIDEPSADVTAHTVEMLGLLGLSSTRPAQAGVRWLLEHQEADGSWFGRWGVNHVYGTGAAVPGLIAAGIDPRSECIRRAVAWLETHQNEDGGWGEDARSYDDPGWIGRGPSTASQTAWALLALHAAGERSQAMTRGIAWLVASQRPDGSWDEPQYTGTGFPSDYYINYHLYRLSFPIMALGRCLAEQAPGADGAPPGIRG